MGCLVIIIVVVGIVSAILNAVISATGTVLTILGNMALVVVVLGALYLTPYMGGAELHSAWFSDPRAWDNRRRNIRFYSLGSIVFGVVSSIAVWALVHVGYLPRIDYYIVVLHGVVVILLWWLGGYMRKIGRY